MLYVSQNWWIGQPVDLISLHCPFLFSAGSIHAFGCFSYNTTVWNTGTIRWSNLWLWAFCVLSVSYFWQRPVLVRAACLPSLWTLLSQISLLSSPHIPAHCTFPLYYCHPLTSYSWTLTLLDDAIGGHHLVLCKSMTSKRASSRIRWYHYNSLAFSDHKSSAVLSSSSSKLTKQKWSQISSRHSKLPQLQLLSKCVWRW